MARTKSYITNALSSFRRPELDDINTFIGAKVPSGMRKAEFVDNLEAFIISKPKRWLSRMLERDLRLLKNLVDLGKGASLYTDYPDYPSVLETIRLIDVDSSDDNFRRLSLSPEIYDIVAPCIDSVISRNEVNGRFVMERVALGILNVYGVLEFGDFVHFMWDAYRQMENMSFSETKFLSLLYSMPLVKVTVYYQDGKTFISSPCASNPEGLYKEMQSEYTDVTEYSTYDVDQLIACGSEAPYFIFGEETPEARAVYQMLMHIGYSEEDTRMEMHDIWVNSQAVFDDKATDALLSCVTRKMDSIPSFDKYASYMQMVATYANSLPKWLLKGFNSNDKNLLKVIIKEDAPVDGVLDSETYQPFSLPEPSVSEGFGVDMLDDIMKSLFTAVPHVAMNDPCPCGSGLRYRNCHGKHMS